MQLRITPVQADLVWEDVEANLAHYEALLEHSLKKGSTDLIVLPELFSTGFTMNTTALAEPMDGRTVRWMAAQSCKWDAVLTGSVIIEEAGHFYNRLIWMQPDGQYRHYSKKHLFRMAHENDHYTAGSDRLLVTLNGWKVCPLICYDLRFPVWSRNAFAEQGELYDLLIYVANWPSQRALQWRALLPARAIENQAFLAGINRVGTDGKGNVYSGDSAIFDFKGSRIDTILPGKEAVATFILDKQLLIDFRKQFQVGLDADRFQLL